MHTDSTLEAGIFEYPDWDSNDYIDKTVLIKSVARTKSDNTTLTSVVVSVDIINGGLCVINEPKPYTTQEAWDFEYAPMTIGGYYSDYYLESEATLITTLTDTKNDFDIYNGSNWSALYLSMATCRISKYHWAYYDFGIQWNYYVNGYTLTSNGWKGPYPFADTLGPSKKEKSNDGLELPNTIYSFDQKKTIREDDSNPLNKGKFVEFYPRDFLYYYDLREDLYPGIYNTEVHAYDTEQYELNNLVDVATPASVDFLIPTWKLKILNESKWYDYPYNPSVPQTGPIYIKRTEYNAGEKIHLMIWRPFEYYEKNSLNFTITNSTSGTTIFEKDLQDTDYTLDNFTTHEYVVDTLSYYHYIWNTTGIEPGFYTIRAEELDYNDSINVVQEEEIQICSFYEQWENDGLWSTVWPEPEGDDIEYWKIKELGGNTYCANRYLLEAHYETGYHLSQTSTECTFDFTNEHPAMLEVCMTINRHWDHDLYAWVWEEQLADFNIELTKDGSNFTTVRALYLPDYMDYNWNDDPPSNYDPELEYTMLCAMNYYFPVGEIPGLGQSLEVKFNINGISDFYTDEPEDNKINTVHFDEIRLWYMKGREHRPYPKNLVANQAKESNTVTLTFDTPEITNSIYPDQYIIYRDGIKIGETTNTTFVDTEINGNREYNYVVVADYPGLDYHESSMLDCSIKYTTQEIVYTRPSYFTLTKGVGMLDNSVTLEWIEPDPSVIRYEIYRNDSLINTTTDVMYEDYLLEDGTHNYCVKARYGEESYEVSDPTEILTVGIYSSVLPIYEDFEHEGELPLCWYNKTPSHSTGNLWAADQTTVNGIIPYEGNYSAYVSGESLHECWCND
ncbi:MAG: hypothetical protein KAS62_02140, partial [Candidatus Delongbacteria bacterium]|nr:hypothetical protein [Candidatus Delongbacteria bacterium]